MGDEKRRIDLLLLFLLLSKCHLKGRTFSNRNTFNAKLIIFQPQSRADFVRRDCIFEWFIGRVSVLVSPLVCFRNARRLGIPWPSGHCAMVWGCWNISKTLARACTGAGRSDIVPWDWDWDRDRFSPEFPPSLICIYRRHKTEVKPIAGRKKSLAANFVQLESRVGPETDEKISRERLHPTLGAFHPRQAIRGRSQLITSIHNSDIFAHGLFLGSLENSCILVDLL